MFLEIGNSH
ncbi:UNVERIFIED_CONTAM: hypothetical protein GTU68_056667 [Idotea baltica]|nr:hypothetical protein [Idotea baltica]